MRITITHKARKLRRSCNVISAATVRFFPVLEAIESRFGMSWVLVKWVEEDYVSIVSSSWVLEPNPIPTDGLPVAGVCYWQRKSSKWDVEILGLAGIPKNTSIYTSYILRCLYLLELPLSDHRYKPALLVCSHCVLTVLTVSRFLLHDRYLS